MKLEIRDAMAFADPLEEQDNSFQVELFDRLPDDLIIQILLRAIADRHHSLDDAARKVV